MNRTCARKENYSIGLSYQSKDQLFVDRTWICRIDFWQRMNPSISNRYGIGWDEWPFDMKWQHNNLYFKCTRHCSSGKTYFLIEPHLRSLRTNYSLFGKCILVEKSWNNEFLDAAADCSRTVIGTVLSLWEAVARKRWNLSFLCGGNAENKERVIGIRSRPFVWWPENPK